MTVLETKDLCHTYGGSDRPAMDDVSITIRKGVRTVLLGANGAGKSTLFYHMNGIMRPDSGCVLTFGEKMSYRKKALRATRSRIAVVLQNPDDQIFGQTVESDVAYGPTNLRLDEETVRERVDRALFMTGLQDLRDRNTMQLSYGQRKRLALAGALAMRPEVLIMDEPTAGLDPQMAQDLMELCEQLHDSGTTVVLSTHDVDLAYAWAEEIHVLRMGKLIYSGHPEGFFSNDQQVYLSGLVQPAIYVMNRCMSSIGCVPEEPYPRSEVQMTAKISKAPVGRITVLPFEGDGSLERLDEAAAGLRSPSVGVYGSVCRGAAAEAGIGADFMFSGLDACIGESLTGRDSVLICDRDCVSAVVRRLEAMAGFGPAMDYTVL